MTLLSELGAIVLAAGLSSRMQGENKLLKVWRGKPLLAHCLETVSALGLAHICVVTGGNFEVRRLTATWPVTCVENPAFATGMASSIAAGILATPVSIVGAFIVLGDMPLVQGSDYDTLAAEFAPEHDRDICVTMYKERRGHPVLFGKSHFPGLLALQGDRGGGELIVRNSERVVRVQNASQAVLRDFDTLEDFQNK
ncbi:MAG: nucleotidyltransferase family protein [Hyphomicrobiales bacterium]|nr:nucleotidyltransferase family protein [Hyphomicrobiales bacterium]